MSAKERVGIYGGTFNPPHIGHLNAVKRFHSALRLDKVIIIPAGDPPHKKVSDQVDSFIRLEMTKKAFAQFGDDVEVSDFEIRKPGKSYTVDTLSYFASKNRTLYLLCGTDMFLSFDQWKDFDTIFDLAKIVCMPRDSKSIDTILEKKAEYKSLYNARCIILRGKCVELSSTDVREMIRDQLNVDGLVPEDVLSVIKREHLYE